MPRYSARYMSPGYTRAHLYYRTIMFHHAAANVSKAIGSGSSLLIVSIPELLASSISTLYIEGAEHVPNGTAVLASLSSVRCVYSVNPNKHTRSARNVDHTASPSAVQPLHSEDFLRHYLIDEEAKLEWRNGIPLSNNPDRFE